MTVPPSPFEGDAVLFVFLAMIVSLVLAGLVLAYAAWPSRGRSLPDQVPAGRWLGRMLESVSTPDPALRPEQGTEHDSEQDAHASVSV